MARSRASLLAVAVAGVAMCFLAQLAFVAPRALLPPRKPEPSTVALQASAEEMREVDRRSVLSTLPVAAALWTASASQVNAEGEAAPAPAPEAAAPAVDLEAAKKARAQEMVAEPAPPPKPAKKNIVVVGGSGFVGSHVAELLIKEGYAVTSFSRSTPKEQAEKVKKTLGSALEDVEYVQLDALAGDKIKKDLFKGAEAVVSCVGIVPGGAKAAYAGLLPVTKLGWGDFEQRRGNGAANERIAAAAKEAGVKRFVYISVASALSDGPGQVLFADYMKGKADAEIAVKAAFPDNALIIRPAIIEGGPPGPPVPPWVPGVKVEPVAKLAVAGALGRQSGIVDGGDAIKKAAASA